MSSGKGKKKEDKRVNPKGGASGTATSGDGLCPKTREELEEELKAFQKSSKLSLSPSEIAALKSGSGSAVVADNSAAAFLAARSGGSRLVIDVDNNSGPLVGGGEKLATASTPLSVNSDFFSFVDASPSVTDAGATSSGVREDNVECLGEVGDCLMDQEPESRVAGPLRRGRIDELGVRGTSWAERMGRSSSLERAGKRRRISQGARGEAADEHDSAWDSAELREVDDLITSIGADVAELATLVKSNTNTRMEIKFTVNALAGKVQRLVDTRLWVTKVFDRVHFLGRTLSKIVATQTSPSTSPRSGSGSTGVQRSGTGSTGVERSGEVPAVSSVEAPPLKQRLRRRGAGRQTGVQTGVPSGGGSIGESITAAASSGSRAEPGKEDPSTNQGKNIGPMARAAQLGSGLSSGGGAAGSWAEVTSRKRKSEQKQAAVPARETRRPEAVVIRTPNGDYSEILKKVKKDPTLVKVGADVDKIRKTATGSLILEFRKGSFGVAEGHREAISRVLGDDVVIMAKTPEQEVVVKDLDEVTTKEEVAVALTEMLGETISVQAVKTLRHSFGGTKVAVIKVSVTLARRAVEVGKVRVGWVVGRIRYGSSPTDVSRCYKCWEPGHVAAKCKSVANRTQDCFKCGLSGHKAAECQDACEEWALSKIFSGARRSAEGRAMPNEKGQTAGGAGERGQL